MINKNYYLKLLTFSIILLTLSIFLVYAKNIQHAKFLNILETNLLIKTKNKIYSQLQKTQYSIQSLIQATHLKQDLLLCKTELQQCNLNCLNTSNLQNQTTKNQQNTTSKNPDQQSQQEKLQILLVNWPEYGFITLNNPKNYKLGLVVDNHNIFIGKITQYSKSLLYAQTIFANDFVLPVYLQKTKAYGLLQNIDGQPKIYNINIKHTIKAHDTVFLLDEKYPTNIKIGTIDKIYKDNAQPFQQATIKPYYDINSINRISNISVISQNQ